jgi:hypothetical protein
LAWPVNVRNSLGYARLFLADYGTARMREIAWQIWQIQGNCLNIYNLDCRATTNSTRKMFTNEPSAFFRESMREVKMKEIEAEDPYLQSGSKQEVDLCIFKKKLK